jgi:hypothetical protein
MFIRLTMCTHRKALRCFENIEKHHLQQALANKGLSIFLNFIECRLVYFTGSL